MANRTFKIQRVGTVFRQKPIQRDMEINIDRALLVGTTQMAHRTRELAPVLRYILAPDIGSSPQKNGKMSFIYGSRVPYGRRWEYEHRTKSGYFRKSVGHYAPIVARDISSAVEGMVAKYAREIKI